MFQKHSTFIIVMGQIIQNCLFHFVLICFVLQFESPLFELFRFMLSNKTLRFDAAKNEYGECLKFKPIRILDITCVPFPVNQKRPKSELSQTIVYKNSKMVPAFYQKWDSLVFRFWCFPDFELPVFGRLLYYKPDLPKPIFGP